jgi:predicted small integral membrane protein
MLLAACIALWKGWQLHSGRMALFACALAALALAMAVWHFTRKPPQPRV